MARSVLVESHVLYGETSFWLSQLPGMSFDTFLRGMKLPYSVLLLRDLLVAERFKIEYCRRDTPCELQRQKIKNLTASVKPKITVWGAFLDLNSAVIVGRYRRNKFIPITTLQLNEEETEAEYNSQITQWNCERPSKPLRTNTYQNQTPYHSIFEKLF